MSPRLLKNALARVALVAGIAMQVAGAWAQAMTDGEVRKVDIAAGKVTIRHAPLTELDMPAMTMVFKVADPTLLDDLKPGDNIRFVATRDGGVFTVTRLERAR